MNKLKKIIFLSFKIIPLVATFITLIFLVKNFYEVKYFNKKATFENIDKIYSRKFFGSSAISEDVFENIKKIDKNTIVLLGGSTLILPGLCDKKKLSRITFSSKLKTWLYPKKINVVNLGHCAEDTIGTMNNLTFILENSSPRAVLLYPGHNDYTNTFRDVILNKLRFFSCDFIQEFTQFLSVENSFRVHYFITNAVEAPLARLFNSIDSSVYSPKELLEYSKKISQVYTKNLKKIIDSTAKRNIPIIIITPISNLSYPPIGANKATLNLYKEGMLKKDVQTLIDVNEFDFLGHDVREKIDGVNYIKKLTGDKVFVVNIYDKLIKKNDIQLFSDYFTDIFHLSEKGHEFVFEEIKNEIDKRHLF